MIKKILSLLFIIAAVCSTAALWFVYPEAAQPWVKWGAVGLTSILVLLALIWCWKHRSKKDVELHDQQVLLKQDTKVIKQLFRIAAKQIRGKGRDKLESLYSSPWYLVLGGEHDAKSAILRQNGLEPVSERYLDESDTEQYLRFWANENAVVIEVGHRIFDDEGIDEELWSVLAKQILKYRPRQGINAIISVISCARLMVGDKKERNKLASIYQEAVLSMSGALNLDLPLYNAFSKADTIADFTDFFENLSGSDADTPFGLTFTYEQSKRYDKPQFEQQSQQLIESLASQQFDLLRNISSEKSGSVIGLPYQLKIFFERVNELLTDIGRENRVREAVWIRGAYLMSTGQKGQEFDLLTQAVAERAEFNSSSTREQAPGRRSYFASKLFNQVVLPEKNITGVNEWRHYGYLAFRTLAVCAVIGAISFAGVTLKDNWNSDEEWRADAITQLRVYSSDLLRLSDNYSTSDMVAVLSKLREIAVKGVEPKSWDEKVSVKQDETAAQIYKAYEDQLNHILLPKLEELISGELYVYVNLGNPSKIFEILRFYKMIFNHNQLNLEEMQTYLLDNLKDQGEVSSDEIEAISLLIDDLFLSDYGQNIEPNSALIAVATNNLEGLSPERLIYARIKSLPQYRAQVDLRRQLGEKFDSMFTFSEDFHGYLIPEIFTKLGYSQIDLTAKSALLRTKLQEFKAIQGDLSFPSVTELTDLSKKIQRLYFADYIYHWKDLVNNIQVKQFASQEELGFALRSARNPATSPLLDVLGAVVVNTTLATENQPDTKGSKRTASQLGLKKVKKVLNKANRINRAVGEKLLRLQPSFVVNEAFMSFEKYVNGASKGKAIPLDLMIAQFDSLNDFYDAALSSNNPAKAFHEYAIAHANGSKGPIFEFKTVGNKAPSRVSGWADDIGDQTWNQILNGGTEYINNQWDERVYQFYLSAIEGRFPFSPHGRGEVNLDDFAQFFKPSGRVDSFVDELLKPFVYWDNGRLKLNEVDGLVLPIQPSTLKQLENARQLSRTFFGSSGQKLALKIALRASSMSTNSTEFQLKEAESTFTYKHGPRVWREMTWPSMGVDGYLSANFYKGKNRTATQSYSGQWALFRVIFANESSATSNRLVRKLSYKLDKNSIVLDYTLPNANQTLDKGLFTQFGLNKKL